MKYQQKTFTFSYGSKDYAKNWEDVFGKKTEEDLEEEKTEEEAKEDKE